MKKTWNQSLAQLREMSDVQSSKELHYCVYLSAMKQGEIHRSRVAYC